MEDKKTKLWVVTINEAKDCSLPEKEDVIRFFEKHCETYVFQLEAGLDTGNRHYQCAIRLKFRKKKTTLLNDIEKAGFKAFQWQIEFMYGTLQEAYEYCTKSETALEPPISNLPIYLGADVQFLEKTSGRYPWQEDLLKELLLPDLQHFKTPDDRKIIWIADTYGCSGKSKFVKYMVLHHSDSCKVAFGSASQLRSALISAGPRRCYFVDIPRTLGRDDDIYSVISALEDLKNGFVVSSMYGKNAQLVMNPPHVVVFSNMSAPLDSMSSDRWDEREIDFEKNFDAGDWHPAKTSWDNADDTTYTAELQKLYRDM